MRLIACVADDAPEVHCRMCRVEHLFIFPLAAYGLLREHPGTVIGLTGEALLPACQFFCGRLFVHDELLVLFRAA
jgi:hypothetical protein